jgi:hypothetical protein
MKYGFQNLMRCIVWATLFCLASPALAQDAGRRSRIPPNLTTGPEIGARIPMFAAVDQHGARRHFDDIKGQAGAMILFYRSADW